MISHILPSHPVHDLWANRVRGPESDQQAVEVMPFSAIRFHDLVFEDWVDGDTFKLGFNGLEGNSDPPSAWTSPPKRQVFEFCGLGEVEQWYSYVRERW